MIKSQMSRFLTHHLKRYKLIKIKIKQIAMQFQMTSLPKRCAIWSAGLHTHKNHADYPKFNYRQPLVYPRCSVHKQYLSFLSIYYTNVLHDTKGNNLLRKFFILMEYKKPENVIPIIPTFLYCQKVEIRCYLSGP